MVSKYFRKNHIVVSIVVCAVLIILTVYFVYSMKKSQTQTQTQTIETFGGSNESASFNIPAIKKWQFPSSVDRWYEIKQNGYRIDFKDLGFTLPNSKMTIMFLFNCESKVGYWRNIFHFTNSGNNCCEKGDRIPAMWVYPDYTNNFHIRFSTDDYGNDGYDPRYMRDNKTVPELLTLVFDDNKFSFYANDTLLESKVYHNIYKRDDKTVLHIGDPWHWNGNLHIKNFTIYDGVLEKHHISEIYNKLKGIAGELTFF